MSIPSFYLPTAIKISLAVRTVATDALVDPTTLALVIFDGVNTTTKTIDDLDHDGTGLYSYVHLLPTTAIAGVFNVKASVDAAVAASAVTQYEPFEILEAPVMSA